MSTGSLSRLRAHPGRRGRLRRPGAGFTLLELVLVAVISSILFLLIIRWVLALGAATSLAMDSAGTQRIADAAQAAFAADVDGAQPCAPDESSPVRAIAPDQVSFTVTAPGAAGGSVLVTWRVKAAGSGYVLSRTQAAPSGSDPCTFGPASEKTYAESLTGVQTSRILAGDVTLRPAFYPVTGGQDVTATDQAWGDCTKHESADRCYAGALGVNWLFHTPDGAAPIGVGRSFSFATSGKGLQ